MHSENITPDLCAKIECNMKQIIPPALNKGDCIGLVATARWIDPALLSPAVQLIEGKGYRVRIGKFVTERNFQLAGNDADRAEDLMEMLLDPDVSAVLMVRGGYGTVRVLDLLDLSVLRNYPKWICGYSDITVLHRALNSMGIASLHSTMPVSFSDNPARVIDSLFDALSGKRASMDFEAKTFNVDPKNPPISGLLTGGNLSVMYSLLGSEQMKFNEGDILFMEDVDEYLYHIDRMLTALKRAGIFKKVKAVLVGGMTGLKDNTREFGFATDNPWGKTVEEMILDATDNKLPLIFGVPCGHQPENFTLKFGCEIHLKSCSGRVIVDF